MSQVLERTSRFRMPVLPGEPFTLEHFAAFASELVLDNDEKWVLEPFEEEFALSVFQGSKVCWLVVPEGNGKTTLVAGLALYHAYFRSEAWVTVAASSRDQARIMYRQAKGFVDRSDSLSGFKCFDGYRRIDFLETGSQIEVFAADDRTGDGVIPTFAILDELHRHRDLGLYETWKGKLRKRQGQILVISTAGEVGSEFEEERTRLRQEATDVDVDGCFTKSETWFEGRLLNVVHDYAIPEDGDINDLDVVKAANPASYVTLDSLREKRVMVRNDQHWSRFTCNKSSRSVQAAITESEWFSAVAPDGIPAGVPVVAGLDLGWKYDTTALVPLWVRDAEFRVLGPAEILTPPRDGTQMSGRLVEDAIERLHRRNPIRMLVMDMSNQGPHVAEWAEQTLGIPVMDRSQTNQFLTMDYSRFMEALREGWLKHSGDPGLTRHVLNARAKLLPAGDFVFERPKDSRHGSQHVQKSREVDALDAATMAHTFAAAELVEPVATGWTAV